jgi:hypothetical protein
MTPWNSIDEGVVAYEPRQLGFGEAKESPCASCQTAPCCTHLPLHTFKVTNMLELDHALYLLNFDRIQLGLSASGDWSVYYVYPCRFLDRETFGCTVHNTAEQPKICVHYNPYNCWYKRVFTRSTSQEFLQIDRPRMDFIRQYIVFDEGRNIVGAPDWAFLVDMLAKLPAQREAMAAEPSLTDPVLQEWQNMVIHQQPAANGAQVAYGYDALQEPCSGCEAHCCQTLVFPQGMPASMSSLDYYRFVLGFPGVEVAIADDVWSIVVKTRCRHLEGNRCGVYGQPERPLICNYYDAWKCTYRINFGLPRPAGFLRVRLEQFQAVSECFGFDQHGVIVQFPPTEAIRQNIEERWRSSPQPAPVISLPVLATAVS